MTDLASNADRALGALQPERTYVARGPWNAALHRLLANRMAVVGGLIVLGFLVLAIGGRALAPKDPLYQDLFRMTEAPTSEFWFGTDELGRDLLSRIIVGARTAMIIATLVTLISAGLGAIIGLISAYAGGWVDSAFMRLADLLLAFPPFLLAAFINTTLRPPVGHGMVSLSNRTGIDFIGDRLVIDVVVVFGSLAAVSWSGYARLIRSQVLSLRRREFIEAAKSVGAPSGAILRRHVMPNAIAPIVVAVSVNFGNAILSEASLSFLGIGIQPPTPSWGQMINANLDQWRHFPHLVLIPGGVLTLLILGFNFLGDGIADALDPRQQSRRGDK